VFHRVRIALTLWVHGMFSVFENFTCAYSVLEITGGHGQISSPNTKNDLAFCLEDRVCTFALKCIESYNSNRCTFCVI